MPPKTKKDKESGQRNAPTALQGAEKEKNQLAHSGKGNDSKPAATSTPPVIIDSSTNASVVSPPKAQSKNHQDVIPTSPCATMPKSPPASSPKRKGGNLPTRKDIVKQKQAGAGLKITCYGFATDLPIEAYLFTKDDDHDGFLYGFKQFVDNVDTVKQEELSEANFTSYLVRRKPQSANEIMTGGGYWRHVMLRWVPGELSTKQSRAHGLAVLSKFLNGTDNTKYPGPAIPTLDCTNESDPHALDMFFLDKDIVDIIQRVFDESDLNKDFYSTYKSLALKLWSGENYPEYARGLGFP